MLGSRAVTQLLLLLLLLTCWTTQGRAVPLGSSPAWAQCQRLSQKLCTLAWSAHPPTAHVVSGILHAYAGASLRSPRLRDGEDSVALVGAGGLKAIRERTGKWGSWENHGPESTCGVKVLTFMLLLHSRIYQEK